jgi:hypothetical protein
MDQRIIYPNDNGGVDVIIPAPEFADQIEAIANKDVPAGKPWRIIDGSALPSRDSRDRWLWTDEGQLDVRMPTQEELDAAAAADVRAQRDSLLATQVDPVVSNPLRWADLSAEQQAAWAAYRRALLDITAQAGFPHNIVWPVAPQ